jgi:uncharacterized membrane protein YhaH (DUF805 family)
MSTPARRRSFWDGANGAIAALAVAVFVAFLLVALSGDAVQAGERNDCAGGATLIQVLYWSTLLLVVLYVLKAVRGRRRGQSGRALLYVAATLIVAIGMISAHAVITAKYSETNCGTLWAGR